MHVACSYCWVCVQMKTKVNGPQPRHLLRDFVEPFTVVRRSVVCRVADAIGRMDDSGAGYDQSELKDFGMDHSKWRDRGFQTE